MGVRSGLVGKTYPFGGEIDPAKANYARAGTTGTVPVGGYASNRFGLYDMCGNVVEWVADRYDPSYYVRSPQVDPRDPRPGSTD